MLRKRLRLVAVVGIVTVSTLSATMLWSYWRIDQLRTESTLSSELSSGLGDLQFLTTEYLTTRNARALRQWESRHARLGELIENAQIQDDDVRVLLPEIITRHDVMGSLFKKLIGLDLQGLPADRAEVAERAIVSRLLTQSLALASLNERIVVNVRQHQQSFERWTVVIVACVLIISVAVMAILYFSILSRLTQQAHTLSDAVLRLGEGSLDEPVQQSGDSDFKEPFRALEQTRVRLAGAIAQLQQERADLDNFVYVASHDFKAPLRGIDNLASWIEEDAGDSLNPEACEHLRLLRNRVTRLEILLDDLLAYSRAGRVKVESETVDTNALVKMIVSDIGPREGVRVEIDPNMPVILSPRTPLEHVFFNLIANAIKHHDRSDVVIRVDSEPFKNGYKFRVADDGPGIPEKFRQRIFEMFQTLRPRDEVEGSGMGLAITKRLVQSCNGTVDVISGEGRNSTFEFTWYPSEEKNADIVS